MAEPTSIPPKLAEALFDAVRAYIPHIFTRKSRVQPKEILITSAKRLFQQHRSTAEITAVQYWQPGPPQSTDIDRQGGHSATLGGPRSMPILATACATVGGWGRLSSAQ
jgi:hypothetical protein